MSNTFTDYFISCDSLQDTRIINDIPNMVGGACQSTSSIPPHTPQYIVYLDITTTYSGTTYSML